MAYFDVFNGDADGICALQQLRLIEPREATLVTGVKRDIGLLARVQANPGDEVTVLDISLDRNRDALLGLLERGVRVRYFDHHFPGAIPEHPGLDAYIETFPHKGTSLLVDDFLGGKCRAWAVVGTFGDNFEAAARRAAASLGLDEAQLAALCELGICFELQRLWGAARGPVSRAGRAVPTPAALCGSLRIHRRGPCLPDPPCRLRRGYGAGTGLETGAHGRPLCPLYPARRALGTARERAPGQSAGPDIRTARPCPADPAAQRRIRSQRAGTDGDGNGCRCPVPPVPHRGWP